MTESVVNTPHNPVTTHGTDSNGKVAPMGATTDASGAPAVKTVAEIQQPLGAVETRTFTFDEEAQGVALSNGTLTVAAANLCTADSFTSGKKRCRITFHTEDGGIPFMHMIIATLNAGDDATAATRLSIATEVTENSTASADSKKRVISPFSPLIEWDLTGTLSTIDRVDLVGVASSLTGTGTTVVLANIEVW